MFSNLFSERMDEMPKEVIVVPKIVTKTLPVTIKGKTLVARPVIYDGSRLIPALSPEGHYGAYLNALRMSKGPGYGFSCIAIKYALQVANNMLTRPLPRELLRLGIRALPHDPEKNLLHVIAKRGPFMRRDAVHSARGKNGHITFIVASVEWTDWRTSLEIRFVEDIITKKQVLCFLQLAGEFGILQGRRCGSPISKRKSYRESHRAGWGTFTVETE